MLLTQKASIILHGTALHHANTVCLYLAENSYIIDRYYPCRSALKELACHRSLTHLISSLVL